MMKRYLFEKIRGKSAYQGLFKRLHALALKGMNIGCGDCLNDSGEVSVIRLLAEQSSRLLTVFDVGANVGSYAMQVLVLLEPRVHLYSFEPSKTAYETLLKRLAGQANARAYNIGFGEKAAVGHLFADREGSELASVFPRRLGHFGIEVKVREPIQLKRLDDFCIESGISCIDLLKLDVEGNELNVLAGARRMIENDAIDLIQFEFGGCNIDSRTFLQDFYYLLTPKYKLYRIVRDGLVALNGYDERLEVFITTNYLAVRCGASYSVDGSRSLI